MDDFLPTSDHAYQQVLDAIPDLVLVKGPKSRIVWANKAFRTYYCMSNEQLRDLIDSPLVEPDITQTYIQDDTKVFTTGQVLDIPMEPVKRYDGASGKPARSHSKRPMPDRDTQQTKDGHLHPKAIDRASSCLVGLRPNPTSHHQLVLQCDGRHAQRWNINSLKRLHRKHLDLHRPRYRNRRCLSDIAEKIFLNLFLLRRKSATGPA
jgi:PAS domain-containing protein